MAVNVVEPLQRLMFGYARKGLLDWSKAPPEIRNRAKQCLENKIADGEPEASLTIKAALGGATDGRLKFIPMPKVPDNDKDYARSFFLPMSDSKNGAARAAFDLFILVDVRNSLGFRFEPADEPAFAHNYVHVQMNRKMIRGGLAAAGIPEWIPASYPAFPIRTQGPLQMFLAMATAVHGRDEKGVASLIQQALADHPKESRFCLEQLAALYP